MRLQNENEELGLTLNNLEVPGIHGSPSIGHCDWTSGLICNLYFDSYNCIVGFPAEVAQLPKYKLGVTSGLLLIFMWCIGRNAKRIMKIKMKKIIKEAVEQDQFAVRGNRETRKAILVL